MTKGNLIGDDLAALRLLARANLINFRGHSRVHLNYRPFVLVFSFNNFVLEF